MGYAKLRAENPTDVEMDDTTFLEKVRRFKYPNLSPEKMRALADAYESGGGGTPTAAKAPPAPSPTGKLSQTPLGAVPVLGQAIRGAEAVQAAGGPLGAIEATTRHAGREASDIFGGIGQLLTGIPYAGGLAARNFGRAVGLPENVDPTLAAETQQATQSFGKVAKTMPGEIAGQLVREGYDPGRAFIEKPVTTGLDAMMFAGLPSMGAKVGSRVAAMAGKEAAAKAAATAAETMRPMAVVKTAIREAGEREPFIKGMVERSNQIGKARDLVATSEKHAATVSEAESARLERAFQGLTKQEREVATSLVAGTSQLRPESEIAPRFLHDVSLNETSRQRITRAVDAYKQGIEAEQAKRIARGELTSEIIKRRAGQEQRLAFGGEQAAKLEAAPRSKPGVIEALDKATESLAAPELGLPAPTYVPGMPKKMTIRQLIGNLRGPTGEAPTPGFLKRSTGATYLSGESERDLGRLAAKHSEVSIRNDRNIEISRGIPKLPGVRPIKSIGEVDWTKESLFAPGMYARNVSQAIQEGGDVLASALKSRDAVGELDKGFRATLIKEPGQAAQAMGPFYAVPKAVAKEITGQLKGGGPLWSRILFDTPNTFQRWAVLTLRPGFYVNNVVGGTGLAALSGGKPSAFIRALKPSVIAQMPEELRGSGFAAVEAPSAGGGVLQPIAKASGILNEQVDEYFRRVAFLSDVDRRAAAQAVKQTGKLLERGLSYAQKAERLGPGGIEESVKYVNRFFNDYTRQSPMQRQVLRRVFPFQSFVTHMARLATRLPLQHPMRADLLAKATQLANDYRDDRFAQAGHTNLPAYRTSQFPILAQPGGGMTTFGTQGFNPTSGLGTSSAEFQAAPGVGALSEAAAGQAGIAGRTALEQIFGRQIGTGRAFTSPDVIESYGGGLSRRNPDTGKMIPSGTPRPGLADVVRENLPLASLLEKLRVPNDTYDLWGGFQGFGGPVETGTGAGEMPRPRRYSGREALLAYLGLPVRGFESAELEYPESVKKALQAADAEEKRRQAARKRKKEAK